MKKFKMPREETKSPKKNNESIGNSINLSMLNDSNMNLQQFERYFEIDVISHLYISLTI